MSAHRVLRGALWNYGGQVAVILAQIIYASATSRLVSPTQFGYYAVALTISGLITLLATGGLSQAVGRLIEVDYATTRALAAYAVALGVLAACVMYFSAGAWASVWGAPGARHAVQLLAIAALTAPIYSLSSGLMRREGLFRRLALLTVVGNLLAMVVGFYFVRWRGSAESLLVFPILAQVLTLVPVIWAMRRHHFGPFQFSDARSALSFSWKLMIASLLSYGVHNMSRWATARSVGLGGMGQWNRADTLTTVPFGQLQVAVVQALYPEFRHDIGSSDRARVVWTDLLILSVWFVGPCAAIAAVVLPPLVPIVFGSGWALASSLIAPLVFGSALLLQSTLLSTAVEALGRFGWIWMTQIVLTVFQVGIVFAIFRSSSVTVAVVGFGLTSVVRHLVHIGLCARAGYINSIRLSRGYCLAILASLWCYFSSLLARGFIDGGGWSGTWIGLSSTAVLLLVGGFMTVRWRRLPPVVLARRYGILRG